jgi:hypothetical protein
MNRIAVSTLTCLFAATAVQAEVSVDHPASGSAVPYFQPGTAGPWQLVRTGLPAGDVLNASGDSLGDAWPEVYANSGNDRPEAVWSSGGSDAEIMFATYDGGAWSTARNLSGAAGTDNLPTVTTDAQGNRFLAWNQSRSNSTAVYFTALAGDTDEQSVVTELSARRNHARRPALALADDDLLYVAYEEQDNGGSAATLVGIDRISVPRRSGNYVACGGANTPDVARLRTVTTAQTDPSTPADVEAHAESGHVWVDWVDTPGNMGFVELVGGSFTDPQYRPYDVADGTAGVRAQIRSEVLAP